MVSHVLLACELALCAVAIVVSYLFFDRFQTRGRNTNSLVYKATSAAVLAVDALVVMAGGYFLLQTIAEQIQAHRMASTAGVLLAVATVTAISVHQEWSFPLYCAAIVFPFAIYGIWSDTVDTAFAILIFAITTSLSVVYLIVVLYALYGSQSEQSQ